MVAKQRLVDADGRTVDDQLVSWQEVEKDFYQGGILLGNGFSRAVWEKFRYSSIYEAARSHEYTNQPLTLDDTRLFDVMGTTNFEMVLSRLSGAEQVNQALGKESGYIEERYKHIKTALGEAIRAVHVPWNYIKSDIFSKIREALGQYKFVYSTNYDLLLYWSIMSGNTENFKDFFWGREEPFFDITNTEIYGSSTRILYLHGALHIYRDPFSGRTYKSTNKGHLNLLDISGVPLFITEGFASDKLKAIQNSDYLQFAFNQFQNQSGNLVVFGHSLSDEDQHLITAIKNSEVKKIAISIRSSNSPDAIRKRKADLHYFLCHGQKKWKRPELLFFDAQTHPLGSSDIRIEENSHFDRWAS